MIRKAERHIPLVIYSAQREGGGKIMIADDDDRYRTQTGRSTHSLKYIHVLYKKS